MTSHGLFLSFIFFCCCYYYYKAKLMRGRGIHIKRKKQSEYPLSQISGVFYKKHFLFNMAYSHQLFVFVKRDVCFVFGQFKGISNHVRNSCISAQEKKNEMERNEKDV